MLYTISKLKTVIIMSNMTALIFSVTVELSPKGLECLSSSKLVSFVHSSKVVILKHKPCKGWPPYITHTPCSWALHPTD